MKAFFRPLVKVNTLNPFYVTMMLIFPRIVWKCPLCEGSRWGRGGGGGGGGGGGR